LPNSTNPQEVLDAIDILFHQDTCKGVGKVKRCFEQLA
jgi:hypothetical protein